MSGQHPGENTEELRAAIENVTERLYEASVLAAETKSEEFDVAALFDAYDLLRCLNRLLAGKDLKGAFGAPGDWGYGADIGKALHRLYAGGADTNVEGEP